MGVIYLIRGEDVLKAEVIRELEKEYKRELDEKERLAEELLKKKIRESVLEDLSFSSKLQLKEKLNDDELNMMLQEVNLQLGNLTSEITSIKRKLSYLEKMK